MHHPLRQIQAFFCLDGQQIVDQPVVKGTSILAGCQQLIQIDEQDCAWLTGNDIAEQFFAGDCCIVFPEDFALTGMAKDAAGPPVEVDDDIDTAGLNQTKLLDGAACPQDRFILVIRLFMGIQAGKQMRDFLFSDAVEQIGVGQKHFIHNILHLLS